MHIINKFFYRSKNGLDFHHTLSGFDPTSPSTQNLETHHTCEVFLLISGGVEYHIEGRTHEISPMEMVIIKPGEIHTLQIDETQPYERMVLHFPPDLFPSFNDLNLFAPFKAAKTFAHVIPKDFVEKYHLYAHMKEIKNTCEKPDKHVDLKFIAEVIRMVIVLSDCIEELVSMQNTAINTPSKVHQLSYLCMQYINEHITENISVHDLSNALNISVSHIRNTFKRQTHITIQNYIFYQKMQLAQKLLERGESPQSVAKTLGYEYYSTFYHHYQKRYHMPPKSFVRFNKQIYDSQNDRMVNLTNEK